MKRPGQRFDGREWWVVALQLTVESLVAALFLAIWVAMAVGVFALLAWLVSLL